MTVSIPDRSLGRTTDAASREQQPDFFIHGGSMRDEDTISRKSITIVADQRHPATGDSFGNKLYIYLNGEIDTTRTDTILIVCAFVSGLIDSVCFNAWGSFACMQSGTYDPWALGYVILALTSTK